MNEKSSFSNEMDLLQSLKKDARRGSKPRCHFMTHGKSSAVASRLTDLISPFGTVNEKHRFMPLGFEDIQEAQLHSAELLLDADVRKTLLAWWLFKATKWTNTPNFDIASECEIDGRQGILLVEAKAHSIELEKERAGKFSKATDSENSRKNHKKIGDAITQASEGLKLDTGLEWNLSRDDHYQMANRFAWAWKLTQLGMPVVLVYLGFLNADEMKDQGNPFKDAADWENAVRSHSASIFPAEIWNSGQTSKGRLLIPLIRSITVPLPN